MTSKIINLLLLLGIPLNYSLFSSSNLWGWSTMSLIGGGHSFMTSMRRSSRDNFHCKNSWKSVMTVCQMALLGDKGLNNGCFTTGYLLQAVGRRILAVRSRANRTGYATELLILKKSPCVKSAYKMILLSLFSSLSAVKSTI